MIFIYFILFFSVICSAYEPKLLFEYNNSSFYDVDFFQEVGKREWEGLSLTKKQTVFGDFLKRELGVLQGEKLGLHLNPKTAKKLLLRKRQLLINNTYEHLIARPLISNKEVEINKKNLQTSANVWHLLIGFSENKNPAKTSITKQEAENLIYSIRSFISDSLDLGGNLKNTFSFFSLKHSIDPSVKQNKGNLGWVNWGNTVSSFQNPVFKLPPSVLSEPILTKYGYHLAFVEQFDFSDYYYYNQSVYNDLAYKVGMRSLSFDSLKLSSNNFDSLLLNKGGFFIDSLFSKEVYNHIFLKKKKERLISSKYSLLEWLESFKGFGVLVSYNNKDFGVGWFLNKLKNLPSTRVPNFSSFNDFSTFLSSLVLEDLVLLLSKEKKINLSTSFKRDYVDNYKNILFSSFFGSLLSAVSVDSVDVVNKYNSGVFKGDYIHPERVVVSEIKFSSLFDAKTALDKIIGGFSFNKAIALYGGGVREPIGRGVGGFVGESAFLLSVGDISGIITNPNKTFSIFRVDSFLKEVPFSVSAVYKQIEQKIIKERQDLIKVTFLDSFLKKQNIRVYYEAIGL